MKYAFYRLRVITAYLFSRFSPILLFDNIMRGSSAYRLVLEKMC